MENQLKLENFILDSLLDFADKFLSTRVVVPKLAPSVDSKCQNNYKTKTDAPIKLFCHSCTNCYANNIV